MHLTGRHIVAVDDGELNSTVVQWNIDWGCLRTGC